MGCPPKSPMPDLKLPTPSKHPIRNNRPARLQGSQILTKGGLRLFPLDIEFAKLKSLFRLIFAYSLFPIFGNSSCKKSRHLWLKRQPPLRWRFHRLFSSLPAAAAVGPPTMHRPIPQPAAVASATPQAPAAPPEPAALRERQARPGPPERVAPGPPAGPRAQAVPLGPAARVEPAGAAGRVEAAVPEVGTTTERPEPVFVAAALASRSGCGRSLSSMKRRHHFRWSDSAESTSSAVMFREHSNIRGVSRWSGHQFQSPGFNG